MPEAPKRLRGAAADDAIREQLEPLPEGERPTQITIAAIIVFVAGIANLVLYAAGWNIRTNTDTSALGGILPAFIGVALAVGLWRVRYPAVLGMQCLLALTAMFGSGALLVSGNVQGALLSLAVVLLSGWLFWSLIRVMARIQMRDRLARG